MTREKQAKYISEKLMENPEFRKAFAGAITDAINEMVKVIKALQQELCNECEKLSPITPQPCEDAISRQAAIASAEELAIMSEVEVCNLVAQNYQLVYAEDEKIGLVHNDKAKELFGLIKIVSR